MARKKRVKVKDVNTAAEEVVEQGSKPDLSGAESIESSVDTPSEESAAAAPEQELSDAANDDLAAQSEAADAVSEIQAKLAEAQQEAQDYYDKYLRKAADFENFKKRSVQERADLIRYAGEHLARDLLEVVDQLQLAVGADNKGSVDDFAQGVEMVLNRFVDILESHQIRGESAVGNEFDPRKHEALTTLESGEHAPGTVMQELKRPYFFKDKLLRPAQVVVAAEPSKAKVAKVEVESTECADSASDEKVECAEVDGEGDSGVCCSSGEK